MSKKCLNCRIEITERAIGKSTEKKYCSPKCRNRANSKKNYLKWKDTPEFKANRLIKQRIWVEKNRAHFNDLCREKNKEYQKKKREEARTKGFCLSCFKVPAKEGFLRCERCLTMRRDARKKNDRII